MRMKHHNLNYELPGLLSDPKLNLKDDNRADPRLVEVLQSFGFEKSESEIPINSSASLQDKLKFCKEAEIDFENKNKLLFENISPVPAVEHFKEVIKGSEGNEINLHIHKPSNYGGNLPCIVHIHGGGMAILTTQTPCCKHWRDLLCAEGFLVVGIEFRNAAGSLGIHPFPAGLEDCMSGLDWVHHNRGKLDISKIILSGESGGGNLSLAMTLKAKSEKKLEIINGVYALCPYINGDYGNKDASLLSMYENDGYFINSKGLSIMASIYDPKNKPKDNFLAWPYWVDKQTLQGLPPHVISVNELDLLRDEGLAYYRKLAGAGVSVYSRTVNGTCHAAEVVFPNAIPEATTSTIADIKSFVNRL